MTMTVMTGPTSEATEDAIAGNGSRVLGETRLTTFGTNPHRAGIGLPRRGVRVFKDGLPASYTSTAITGRGRPTTLSYDVSVGPSTTRPRDAEIARIDELISRSDIVTLSDADLAWLRPGDRHGDAIRWLMSRGPAILVVTHGDGTATGYTRSGSVHVHGHRVERADSAEWDDTFVAGFLHALTARDLLARGVDRSLRTIGLDDLREILRDAHLSADPAAVGSLAKTG